MTKTMTEIRIPKGVSATIQDGGSCWVVRLSVDQNIQEEPAQPRAEEVNEQQPAEQPATASPVMSEGNTADRKREQARRRKQRQRERERDLSRSGSVTLRDIRPEKRDTSRKSVTESVTLRDVSRSASVTGQDCLIECLTDDIINNKNIINKSNQTIRQRSVAKSVTKRDVSRSASVTPDETREDQQLYLDLDYQLPPNLDTPKAREAWQAWIRYRRDMGGCRKISMKTLHEMFDMLAFYHKTGGERAVVQILEYSVEKERLNQLVAPRDVYRTPPPEPEPKPEEPEISQEESEEVSRSMKEFLEKLRRHRIPQKVTT